MAIAVATDYADHFWGEKHLGFQALYQNMKSGQSAVKELTDFFKERSQLEEEHAKLLAKSLTKLTVHAQSAHTFSAAWVLAKNTLERVGQAQGRLVHSLQELAKEVQKYGDELHKNQRKLKEQETVDAVNLMQTTTTCLQKAKETYSARCVEVEKLKRENGTTKEIAKADAKVGKARDEYTQYIEKYARVRDDFEERMVKVSRTFQRHDETHLKAMIRFLASFAKYNEDSNALCSQVFSEFRNATEALNIGEVMRNFVNSKGTGTERPDFVFFEEPDLDVLLPHAADSANSHNDSNSKAQTKPHSSSHPLSTSVVDQQPVLSSSLDSSSAFVTSTCSAPADANHHGALTTTANNTSLTGDSPTGNGGTADLPFTSSPSVLPIDAAELAFGGNTAKKNSLGADSASRHPPTINHQVEVNLLDLSPIEGSPSSVKEGVSADHSHLQTPANHPPQTSSSGGSSRSKLSSLLLPGRRKANSSGSTGSGSSQKTETAGESRFLKKKQKTKQAARMAKLKSTEDEQPSAKKTTAVDAVADETRSTASSRSDEKPTKELRVDEDGYTIKPDTVRRAGADVDRWHRGGTSSDSDDSADECLAKSIRKLNIRAEGRATASTDELRNVVGSMSIGRAGANSARGAILLKSTTFDAMEGAGRFSVDQSSAWDADTSMPPKLPMRPALTGDDHMNKSFSRYAGMSMDASGWSTAGPLTASLTGSSVRPRPRGGSAMFGGFDGGDVDSSTARGQLAKHRASTDSFASGAADMFGAGASSHGAGRLTDSMSSLHSSASSSASWAAVGNSQGSTTFGSAAVSTNSTGATLIPVAIGVTEHVHAWFQTSSAVGAQAASRTKVRIFGSIQVSYPSSALAVLCAGAGNVSLTSPTLGVDAPPPETPAPPPPLRFCIAKAERIHALIPNKQVLSSEAVSQFTSSERHSFTFDPTGLAAHLKRESEQKPGHPFYNVEVLRYEVRNPVAPLLVTSYWKCDAGTTDLRIDYRLNTDALNSGTARTAGNCDDGGAAIDGRSTTEENSLTNKNNSAGTLLNLKFDTKVNGAVQSHISKPTAEWWKPDERLSWRLTELSSFEEGGGAGSLKARLSVERGPSAPVATFVQFQATDTTLSGCSLELAPESSDHYRLSLLRRKVLSGKYLCDPDTRS